MSMRRGVHIEKYLNITVTAFIIRLFIFEYLIGLYMYTSITHLTNHSTSL
jgi:hypothetical protein